MVSKISDVDRVRDYYLDYYNFIYDMSLDIGSIVYCRRKQWLMYAFKPNGIVLIGENDKTIEIKIQEFRDCVVKPNFRHRTQEFEEIRKYLIEQLSLYFEVGDIVRDYSDGGNYLIANITSESYDCFSLTDAQVEGGIDEIEKIQDISQYIYIRKDVFATDKKIDKYARVDKQRLKYWFIKLKIVNIGAFQ